MKNKLFALLAASLLGLTSCNDNWGENMTPSQIAKDIEARFDFNTWEKLPVRLQSDRNAYVKFYTCDPEKNPNADPVFTTYTDANGLYDGKLDMGQGMIGKDLYAEVGGDIFKARVTNKGVVFSARSRDGEGLVEGWEDICKSLKKDFNSVLKAGRNNTDIVESCMQDIEIHVTMDGTKVKTSMIDYGDELDLQIHYYYYPTEKGAITTAFADEIEGHSWGPQSFQYLFRSDKFLVTPDTNEEWVKRGTINDPNYGYGKTTTLKYYGPIWENENNEIALAGGTDEWPDGITIGFWVKVKAHGQTYLTFTEQIGAINTTATSWSQVGDDIPTSESFNPAMKSYAAAYYNDGAIAKIHWPDELTPVDGENRTFYPIIYGFEDYPGGYDKDYDDLLFLVTVDGQIEDFTKPGMLTRKGTYLFEDMYPLSGDYDMNDVIVEYTYKAYYKYNAGENRAYISSFTYAFEPMHDGATYTNDFYIDYTGEYGSGFYHKVYENNREQLGRVFGGFAYLTGAPDPESNFYGSDAFSRQILNQTVDITNPSKLWRDEQEDGPWVFGVNPFIYVHDTDSQVHLTKYRFTEDYPGNSERAPGVEIIDNEYLNHYLTDLRTDEGNIYPFAMDVSRDGDDVPEDWHFDPVTERVPIYEEYLKFIDWVNGEESGKDWYLQKSK